MEVEERTDEDQTRGVTSFLPCAGNVVLCENNMESWLDQCVAPLSPGVDDDIAAANKVSSVPSNSNPFC